MTKPRYVMTRDEVRAEYILRMRTGVATRTRWCRLKLIKNFNERILASVLVFLLAFCPHVKGSFPDFFLVNHRIKRPEIAGLT